MIKKFKNYKKMNEMSSSLYREESLVDSILDKVAKVGYNNLSKMEVEILNLASTEGLESLKSYVDYSDEEVYSTDKLGHILINGYPYDEWHKHKDEIIRKKKEEENNKHKWSNTEKYKKNNSDNGGKTPPYKVRVYKNNGSELLYYYIIWVDGDNIGNKKKLVTSSDAKYPYGVLSKISSWENKSLDYIYNIVNKQYDHYKDLTVKETLDFETFLILRARYKKGYFNDDNIENKKFKTELNRLFDELKNL